MRCSLTLTFCLYGLDFTLLNIEPLSINNTNKITDTHVGILGFRIDKQNPYSAHSYTVIINVPLLSINKCYMVSFLLIFNSY